MKRLAATSVMMAALGTTAFAQKPVNKMPKQVAIEGDAGQITMVQEPDAERTKREFEGLLNKYPPTVRGVFKQDPTLLTQEQYLKPYPVLANFLSLHPEIALNPSFYLDGLGDNNWREPQDRASRVLNMWDRLLGNLEIFAGFGIAIGLLTWLIRTFLDYRRWNRLSRVQEEVHRKLLDRFSTNEEMMAYIATPAGSRFLESAPISLDTGAASKSMGAPLSRIMWSLQAGLVLVAGGCGMMLASGRMSDDSYLPVEIMGILAVALGVGFAISAAVSYVLSQKMGLLEPAPQKRASRPDHPTDTRPTDARPTDTFGDPQ
jgi:hypothetical protein